MSRKRILIAAAGVLLVAGAVAAVSAPGERGWGRHGEPKMFGVDDDGKHMRGRFGRSLTKDEFDTRAREQFARIDKNSDGILDMSEIEASFAAKGERGKRWAAHRASHMGGSMLRQFDDNRDGKVTREEVRAGIERRFAEADLDSNGRIDDVDLPPNMRGRNWIAEGGHRFMGRGSRHGMGSFGWLNEADANKDGVVTRDEAQALSDRQFVRFDTNKDGAIDRADADAVRKEMQDYRSKRFAHHYGGDKEGRVTREQFTAKSAERFARMDVDNDGSISRAERGGHGWGRDGRHGPKHRGSDEQGSRPSPEAPSEPPARN